MRKTMPMKPYRYKLILTLILIIAMKVSFPQVNVQTAIQYNNREDGNKKDAIKETDISEKINSFEGILKSTEFYGSSPITLQVVFYDRTVVGPFKLKDKHKNITADKYAAKWQKAHQGRKRILMLFVKKSSGGSYKFSTFEVSELPHIFPVVRKYIQDQIMAKSNSHAQAVNEGVNALKNAYDDTYKDKLINNGKPFAEKAKYYPGRAIEDFYYYYFSSKTENKEKYLYYYVVHSEGENSSGEFISANQDAKQISFNDIFEEEKPSSVEDVNSGISMPLYCSEDNSKAQIKDLYSDNDLYYLLYEDGEKKRKTISKDESVYIIISNDEVLDEEDESSSYTSLAEILRSNTECNEKYIEFVNHIQSNSDIDFNTIEDLKEKEYDGKYAFYTSSNIDLYDRLNSIKNQSYHFKKWEGYLLSDNNFYAAYKSCYNRVESHMGFIEKGGNMIGEPVYNRYRDPASITWCNRFAIELTDEIYSKDPTTGKSPAPMKNASNEYYNANRLNTYFSSHTEGSNKIYADLSSKDVKEMWDYINEGYLVFFSNSSHIEIGYPDEGENFGYKLSLEEERFHDDYENALTPYNSFENSEKMTIGAGNAVGIKTFAQFDWWLDNKTNPPNLYLYLGYLKK